jgi:adenylate kinase family enzyme
MDRRILILGPGGSGKTTLAKKISTIAKLHYKSIDELRYMKGFRRSYPPEVIKYNISKFIKRKNWITDNVYNENYMIPVLKRANLIIVLKLSRLKLLHRVVRRELKRSSFRTLLKLVYWAQKFKKHNETKHLDLSTKLKKKIIILGNNNDIEKFLDSLKK